MDISELNNILKLAGLEARQIDAEAPEADAEMVCKDCGDTQGHPTTDCEHDCNDPEGEHWVCKDESVSEGFKIRDKSRGYGVSDKTYKTREEAQDAAVMKSASSGGDYEVIEEWANSGDHVEGEPVAVEIPGENVDTSLRRHIGANAQPVKVEEMMDSYRAFKTELVESDESLLEEVNEDEVRELVLYAENDGTLYSQSTAPIQKNLSKKWAKGIYDHGKAITLWKYHADRAAKAYGKEFGNGDGFAIFSPAVRKAAAKEFADSWQMELEAGNLHEETQDVVEAGGYYTQPVYDMIEKHGIDKVMHELLTALDADTIQAFLNNVQIEEASEEPKFDDMDQETLDSEFGDEDSLYTDVDQETLDMEEDATHSVTAQNKDKIVRDIEKLEMLVRSGQADDSIHRQLSKRMQQLKDLEEGVYEDAKRWKQTSMSAEEAKAEYGEENVKVKAGGLNNGDDMVEVFVEEVTEDDTRVPMTVTGIEYEAGDAGEESLELMIPTELLRNEEKLDAYLTDLIAKETGMMMISYADIEGAPELDEVAYDINEDEMAKEYGMFTDEGDAEVAKICDEVCSKVEAGEMDMDEAIDMAMSALETLSENPEFGEAEDTAVREALVYEIQERCSTLEEAAKPDFLDVDGDGDKEESMKDAAEDKKEAE
jgi:hypothetical protein